MIIVHLTK